MARGLFFWLGFGDAADRRTVQTVQTTTENTDSLGRPAIYYRYRYCYCCIVSPWQQMAVFSSASARQPGLEDAHLLHAAAPTPTAAVPRRLDWIEGLDWIALIN